MMHPLTLLRQILLQYLLHNLLFLDQKCPYDPVLYTVRAPRSSICALYCFLGFGDFGVFPGAESGDLETRTTSQQLSSPEFERGKRDLVDIEKVRRAQRRTNAWELGATVTALWRAALLLGVLVLEFSAWRLHDSYFVGTCVVPGRTSLVTLPKALWQACFS